MVGALVAWMGSDRAGSAMVGGGGKPPRAGLALA